MSDDELSIWQIVYLRLQLWWARFCLWLSRRLMIAASWLSDVRLPEWPGEEDDGTDGLPGLEVRIITCPACGSQTFHAAPQDTAIVVKCPYCHHQDVFRNGQIAEPEPCDFACAYAEPFGFVPEDGCPVHDRPSIEVRAEGA